MFTCVKRFANDRKPSEVAYWILVVIGFVNLYLAMVNAGVLTHDELSGIATVREGIYFDYYLNWYSNNPRGLFILDIFLLYPQYCSYSDAVYRLYDIAAIVIVVISGFRFLRNLFNNKVAKAFVIFFLLFAAFSNTDHNGFIAFGWTYKLRFALAFISLDCLLSYFATGKRRYLSFSSAAYVIASAWYETFMFLCVPIAILMFYRLRQKNELSFNNAVHCLLWFVIPEAIYIAYYVFINSLAASSYAGTTFSVSVTPRLFLETVWVFATGAMPFVRNIGGVTDYLNVLTQLSAEVLFYWTKDIALATVAICLIRNSGIHDTRKFAIWCAIFLVAALSLCLPFGVSQQYTSWIADAANDTRGYGVSYNSFYFLLAAALCFCFFLCSFASKKNERVGDLCLVVLFLGLLVTGLHTDVNNKIYAQDLDRQNDKYELFDQVARSEALANVPDESLIYSPDMLGLYYNMDSLTQYVESFSGKECNFINTLTGNNIKPDYYLRYDSGSELMMLARIDEDNSFSNISIFSVEPVYSSRVLIEWKHPEIKNSMSIGNASLESSDAVSIASISCNAEREIGLSALGVSALDLTVYKKVDTVNPAIISNSLTGPVDMLSSSGMFVSFGDCLPNASL